MPKPPEKQPRRTLRSFIEPRTLKDHLVVGQSGRKLLDEWVREKVARGAADEILALIYGFEKTLDEIARGSVRGRERDHARYELNEIRARIRESRRVGQ